MTAEAVGRMAPAELRRQLRAGGLEEGGAREEQQRRLLEAAWQEVGVGRMQVALTGDPGQEETKLAVERLVVVFRAHVAEAGGGAAWNAKDRARSEGLRGSRWQGHSSMVSRSYYRGGKERVKRRDADGNEKEIERCRMGLETRLPWESRLPDELTVTADQVTRALCRLVSDQRLI